MPTLRAVSSALVASLLAFALVVTGASRPTPVRAAADIPTIRGPITDETGVLAGGEAEIRQAIDRLHAEHNLQLWVLFVHTTDGLTASEFAQQTAEQNSLGANDALLVVALDDRTDQIWLPPGHEDITDAELDRIIGQELEPRLAAGDFVGAVVATADGLGQAVGIEPLPATPPPGAGGGGTIGGPGGDDGGGIGLLPIVLLLGGAALVAWWFVAWRRQRQTAEERDRRTGRLAREANALLIATDDRVRDADQEIGFVEAEYGDEEVTPLREAVAAAREELRQAFAIRQRLDDSEPETPEQREQMLNEIVERSKRAQAALDEQAARIKELRDFERDAPAFLERLPERISAVETRLPASQAAFDSLAPFAPATRAPVVGHIEEARKGLEGAKAAAGRGSSALAAGNRQGAGRQARVAIQGLTGASALLDAVDKLAASARDAQGRIPMELHEADTDLSAAREAARGAPAGDAAGRLAAAETALRAARASANAMPLDPIAALRAATEAHRVADEALAGVRQDAEQRARFAAALDAALSTARTQVDTAADFIATRRGVVGRRARTRLAEAQRALDEAMALRDQDPERALASARRASQLAEDAYDAADDDFGQFGSGPTVRGGGSDVAGAILGGILGGILTGGGRGGGWGGSPWGSSGPFGGGGGGGGWGGPFGGGGGGGWGGGGFGGGGGGGGGGRTRGGRW